MSDFYSCLYRTDECDELDCWTCIYNDEDEEEKDE